MRLTLDLFGWTVILVAANRNNDSSTEDSDEIEHDHVTGSFDIAPPPDGEYVYEERATGFGFATTGHAPASRTPGHESSPSPCPHAATRTHHDPTPSANGYD